MTVFIAVDLCKLFVGVGIDEDTAPSDFAVKPSTVLVEGRQDEHRRTDDVVLGHKTPKAAVLTVVAVVAHHKEVVHLEGVGVSGFAVDVYLSVTNIGVGMAFVVSDYSFVDGPQVGCEAYCFALAGYPDARRTAPVAQCPTVFVGDHIGK